MSSIHSLGEDAFGAAPMVRFSMGESVEVAYLPLQQGALLVDAADARLLSLCRHFARLRDHAGRLSGALSVAECTILEQLTKLVELGAMIPWGKISARVAALPRTGAAPRVSWFAVPTSSRPTELVRAVTSYVVNFRQFGRQPKYLIADDSPSLAQSRALRELLGSRLADGKGAFFYLGLEERRRLVDALTAHGSLPLSVVEFGVLGPYGHTPTIGANRNSILLQTAGEMVLSVDDDTICKPYAAPGGELLPARRLGSEGDPTEFWFFPDRKSALESGRDTEMDVLAAHEELLGKPLYALVQGAGPGRALDFASACSHLMQGIWSGEGRITVTLNGSVGDSGMYSGRNLPMARPPGTRTRLTCSEQVYESALRSREVIRQALSATVCHSSPFMSMFVGLDNRGLLPPFFPVYRNEDGSFGHVLARCLEEGYFGYLPFSLVHDPQNSRSYCREASATVRMSDLLCACVSTWFCTNHAAPAADRLRFLGRHLTEMASTEMEEFRQTVQALLWRQASQRIAYRESLLRQCERTPSYWAADLEREIDAIRAAVAKPDYVLPTDLAQRFPKHEILREAQNLIRQYGELLVWWPAIVEKARELAARDQGAACALSSSSA